MSGMGKKIAIALTAMIVCMIMAVMPWTRAETENADYKIAYEGLDYNGITANTHMNGYPLNGGVGWASAWAGNAAGTSLPASGDAVPSIRPDPARNSLVIYNYRKDAPLYRKLADPIDFSNGGEYWFSIVVLPKASSDAQRSVTDFQYQIGGTNLYFGYKYSATDIVPQLCVNGTAMLSENKKTEANIYYKLVLNISANASGEDTVRLKMYNEASSQDSWDIVYKTEIASSKCTYIGLSTSTLGTAPMYFDEIIVEQFLTDGMSSLVETTENIKNSTGATKQNCKNAMDAVSQISDSVKIADKAYFLDTLISYITSQGWYDEIAVTKLLSMSINTNEPVHVDLTKQIQLTFNYPMSSSAGSFNVVDTKNQSVGAQMTFDGKTICILFDKALTPNNDYILSFSGMKDFKNDAVQIGDIPFSTSLIPSVNCCEGVEYGEGKKIVWEEHDGVTVSAVINGKSAKNGEEIADVGAITLVLSAAEASSGKQAERTIHFNILAAAAPEALNVSVSGNAETGESLLGSYTYYSRNNDAESGSIYRWYKSKTAAGGYEQIPEANQLTYTITEADEGYYIMFEVTPVSAATMKNVGESVKSAPYTGAFAPSVNGLKIDGKVILNGNLNAAFDFIDINQDAEGEHIYQWYSALSKESGLIRLEGENKRTLTISDALIGQYLCVSITPKSAKKPYYGAEVYSDRVAMPAKPIVANVIIKGSASVGKSLAGYYDFYDINGDDEAGSKMEWIDMNTGVVLGTGASIQLTDSMNGKTIVFRVTGESVNQPTTADAVLSAGVTVTEKSSSGGGYGYKGSSSGSTAVTQTVPPVQITPTPAPQATGQDEFYDIKNHWANAYIVELKKAGIIRGNESGNFEPDAAVTRAEFVVMIIRMKNYDALKYENIYSDVDYADWFADAIQTAYNHGLISPDERFRPNDHVSREEAAKMIAGLVDTETIAEESTSPADMETVSGWAALSVDKVSRLGIMTGDDTGRFRPQSNLTRAEAAAILYRVYNQGGKQ